jgi:hypothetical protein
LSVAEDDAAMPLGVRNVFAGLFVLVRGLGGDGEGGEFLVVLAGTNFSIVAEVADEGCTIEKHFESPDFEFPICSGHTGRSQASGRDSQGRSSAFTVGPSQMETVTRRVR